MERHERVQIVRDALAEDLHAVLQLGDKFDSRSIVTAARVLRGAQLLDKHFDGLASERFDGTWRDHILANIYRLHLSDAWNCVCGLAFGEYTVGAVAMGIQGIGHVFGFEACDESSYHELDMAWRAYLDPNADGAEIYRALQGLEL